MPISPESPVLYWVQVVFLFGVGTLVSIFISSRAIPFILTILLERNVLQVLKWKTKQLKQWRKND